MVADLNLVCFCAPDQDCHARVIIYAAVRQAVRRIGQSQRNRASKNCLKGFCGAPKAGRAKNPLSGFA